MSLEENTKIERQALENYPKDKVLKSALSAAVALNLPIAFWQLPECKELHFLISFSGVQKHSKIDLEEAGSGFSFSPFDLRKESLFISNNFHCSISQDTIQVDSNSNNTFDSKQKSFLKNFYDQLDQIDLDKTGFHKIEKPIISVAAPADYLELVELTIQGIKNGQFQKAVPARQIEIPLHADFDPIDTFLKLCEAYDHAFSSLVSIPKVGTWLGATPEVLLEVDANNTFTTVALAATQKRDFEKSTEETAWTQKEIEEQAMVSRYIINCFKKIRLREFEEKGPKTIAAGNLLHLKTNYKVDMTATNFPQLGTVMLELLHPTSAVAGMPKENVLPFLDENEGFNRDFFSGYLGPVNIINSSNIFVNLRCMQIYKTSAFLYAGAGITEDSIPEKELLETELKFNTLLNIINNEN